MRKRAIAAVAVMVLVATLGGAGASSAPATPTERVAAGTSPRAGGPVPARVYRGTMTTTVHYYDFCGPGFSRRYLASERYQANVTVTQSRTVSDGSFVETNPFRLRVEGAANRFGLSLLSSAVVRTPQTGRRHLLVYWALGRRNAAVAGRLANTHRAEGADANHLRAYGPPLTSGCGVGISHVYSVERNAELTGGITARAANLRITGRSLDTLRVFDSVVRASR